MADTLVDALKKLAQDKRGLKEKERQVAHTERRLIVQLGRALSSAGYRLLPVRDGEPEAGKPAGTRGRGLAKRLRCPKCDRRFARPLHLARHMSATHRAKKSAKKAKRAAPKKPA